MVFSLLIVSSPSPCHPSLELLNTVLQSFDFIDDFEANVTPIVIVLDSYRISDENRTKKGRITVETEQRYLEYCRRVEELQRCRANLRLFRCSKHFGFAMSVKFGLEQVQTPFAMIIQHDRVFVKRISCLGDIINAMETHEHIRYVGFPNSANTTHAQQLVSRYGIHDLVHISSRITINNDHFLQPLIFWYDSLKFQNLSFFFSRR